MAYDERLADRVRRALGPRADVVEMKMFGGLAFLVSGKMCCGVLQQELLARVGPAAYEPALAERHVRPMDFTGRPLTGLVLVGPAGHRTERAVKRWVERSLAFVEPLPARKRRPTRTPRSRLPRRGR